MAGEGGQVGAAAGDDTGGLAGQGGLEEVADEPAVAELRGAREPGQVLAQNGLAANLRGFNVTDPKELIRALEHGDIDLALAWGPVAGYFAPPSLNVVPVTPSRAGMLPFVYAIAVGVCRGDEQLRTRLDKAIVDQCSAIEALLDEYKIPQVGERGLACGPASSASASASSPH